jgi:hypothetical protein
VNKSQFVAKISFFLASPFLSSTITSPIIAQASPTNEDTETAVTREGNRFDTCEGTLSRDGRHCFNDDLSRIFIDTNLNPRGGIINRVLVRERPEVPLATPKQGNEPPTLEEYKANVITTGARDLLPSSPFSLEREITFPAQQDLKTQISSEETSLQPDKPSILSGSPSQLQDLLLDEPKTLSIQRIESVVAPGASISTPIGFGASFGQVYGGFGFQSRTRFTNSSDGGLSVGIGLGEPRKIVGLDATVAVLSLFGDDSFERGAFSFKMHRLLPENFAVAVGFENAILWGSSDAGSSIYGVISKFFQLKRNAQEPLSQLTLSLGAGGGRFRSEGDVQNGIEPIWDLFDFELK